MPKVYCDKDYKEACECGKRLAEDMLCSACTAGVGEHKKRLQRLKAYLTRGENAKKRIVKVA